MAVRADVTDDLDVERLFAETIAAFGGIDVVVHAVGSPVTTARVAEVDLDVFDALVRISTRATFIVNREAARHLRNGGAIVNLTSSATMATASPATYSGPTSQGRHLRSRGNSLERRGDQEVRHGGGPRSRQ